MRTGLGLHVPHFPAGAAFDPSDVAGLVAAWDFSDTAKITESGGAVSQVDGAYGTSFALTQGSGSLQPTTGSRTQNGLNVLDFASDRLGASLSLAQPMTVFVVCMFDAVDSTTRCVIGNSTTVAIAAELEGDNEQLAYFGSYRPVGGVLSAATPYILSAEAANAAGDAISQNATRTGTNSLGSNGLASGTTNIGDYDGSRPFDGWVAEVLFYDSVLGTTDREWVRDGLNTKWSVY